MPTWPWPKGEIDYLHGRAVRVLGDPARALQCTAALLDVLDRHGDLADPRHGDVTDVRAWAKRQTTARLHRWLTTAEALQTAYDACVQHRRGDLVRAGNGSPWGANWHDMRHR